MNDISAPVAVTIPLLNPNEPEGLLADVFVREGQRVEIGTPLFTLETTKSTAEVAAEVAGYITGLRLVQGQVVRAGDLLCYLAGTPDWKQPDWSDHPSVSAGQPADTPPHPPASLRDSSPEHLPSGLRITQPALALVRREGIDLSRLPAGVLITEAMLRSLVKETRRDNFQPDAAALDPTAILVYGGGGHGKSIIELLNSLRVYRIAGIVDDGLPAGQSILGLPVLGGAEVLPDWYAQGIRQAINAVGGIGNLQIRLKVFENLARSGFSCPTLVHPAAYVEPSAQLAAGGQVFAQAYVGSDAQIGFGCIVNTGAILSHDCVLEDYANISPGAILAGEVHVGSGALIGMGATINLQVRIGARARIGNGATVKSDVPENGIVPAGTIWPGRSPRLPNQAPPDSTGAGDFN